MGSIATVVQPDRSPLSRAVIATAAFGLDCTPGLLTPASNRAEGDPRIDSWWDHHEFRYLPAIVNRQINAECRGGQFRKDYLKDRAPIACLMAEPYSERDRVRRSADETGPQSWIRP